MMSAEREAVTEKCCANCGKAEIDDVKLKDCELCDLARYCGDKCQKENRERHEAACNQRAAELHDEILFRQPESSCLGDCPICFLPLPLDDSKFGIMSCCGKVVCDGCVYANKIREIEQRLKHKCPFCRKRFVNTDEESMKRMMDRAEANEPNSLREIGMRHNDEEDYDKAFEYLTRAAELGDADAHYSLSFFYREGRGVEKDEDEEIHHLEEAAIAGHPSARYNLGCHEGNNDRYDRSVKHWIIAANLGHDKSIQVLKDCYIDGLISKDDLAAALRAHHAAIEATKSPEREAAARNYK